MQNYFLEWKLKEYLNLRNVDHKLRANYLNLAIKFFEDME